MSRHKKVRALDYEEEYDDFYNPLDEDSFDEDFDGENFESKYLSSGVNLQTNSDNKSGKIEKNRQAIIDEVKSNKTDPKASNSHDKCDPAQVKAPSESKKSAKKQQQQKSSTSSSPSSTSTATKTVPNSTNDSNKIVDSISSDLTKIAIQHCDKHQWQLPLMDMDKKFRDKTYYKHYSNTYKTSVQTKLGLFMAETQASDEQRNKKISEKDKEAIKKQALQTAAKENNDLAKIKGAKVKSTDVGQVETANVTARSTWTHAPVFRTSFYPNKPRENTRSNHEHKQGNQAKQDKEANKKKTIKTTKQYNDMIKGTRPSLSTENVDTAKSTALSQSLYKKEQDKETVKRQCQQTTKEYNDLMKSTRPRVNLVVVGHVDAGKSTLVGHLLYKLGQVTGKQMHRNEVDSQRSGKASFKFAWALDETAEERARGVTIDIALTQFETTNRQVVLLDAPGHVDFIPAVISGAAQADAALLVVDATRGEFETGFTSGGQTREHTFLLRSLGVKYLIVVVNKMDNVDWNWGRFSDIVDQLKPFLKQVGFSLKDDVEFVVCSGLSGENLTERRLDKTLKKSSHPQLEGDGGNWSSMPSLLEAIDNIKPPERMVDKPTRVCITDVFKGMSSGVFLGAKVVSGKLENKQKLVLMPPNENCEVKQVETRDDRSGRAFAGDIVTTVAIGIDMNKYYRGCILCDPLAPCYVTNRFQARVIMFSCMSSILIKGAPIEVHINGTYESGEVRRLISLLNKNTGELIQKKPRCIAKNSSAIIQLRLARVVCCDLYEDNKDLGRFMMRSYGKTIAAGLITKIKSAKIHKSNSKLKTK